MRYALVDTVDIACPYEFPVNETLVNQLAEQIVEMGLIRPLVVLQTGIEEYEVADPRQRLEWLAAQKAYKMNDRKAHMVNAMVVKKSELEAVKSQLGMLI